MKTWRKPQEIYIKPEDMADMLEGTACDGGQYCSSTFCGAGTNYCPNKYN